MKILRLEGLIMNKWKVTLGNNKDNNKGLDFIDALEISLITMKLCGVIDYSWWVILSPFIIEFAITIIVLLYVINKNS